MTRHNCLRLLGLGALTTLTAAATATTVLSIKGPDKAPPVDALKSKPPVGDEWPFVSVIVPARDEERNLPGLLPGLLSQHYPRYEVIVVDDQSTDATGQILAEWSARDARLHVVRGSELPKDEGWMGKPHAMMQGAKLAKGEWLLFTDADTSHSVLSLSTSVAYALEHDIDLFSVLPNMEVVSPSEKLLMPVAGMGISLLYPLFLVNNPRSKVAIANGQYILVRREVYDAVGGAERVKNKIAEDLEFARAVKGDGYSLHIVDGRQLMSVRMYTNFGEVWEGWSKNVVLSMRDNPVQAPLAVLAIFAAMGLPIILTRWVISLWRRAKASGRKDDRLAAGWATAFSSWYIALPMAYRYSIDRASGISPAWTLTLPVGICLFAVLMLSSLVRILAGRGVTWKGRTYAEKA